MKLRRSISKRILASLQYRTGLFAAARKDVSTGYNAAWIRDNVYAAIGAEKFDFNRAIKAYHALLDIFLKHEYKIDWAIKEKPDEKYKYIHARYHPITFDEFHEEWGNMQNDAVGAFLFKVGELYEKGINIIRNDDDKRILQKLVFYLESIEYWHDPDNGIWEENEEVHASSVGACVAGLKKIRKIVNVPEELIRKGQESLNRLLPRESETKEVDLALLSLIYPYNVVTPRQRDKILENVEKTLVREKGVIRYLNDRYYNNGSEAEWCMGFPWLAIIYKIIGNEEKYKYYLRKTHSVMNAKGEIPELYYGKTKRFNENTPLGWAQALYLVATA
ncbi:glycoside hydrolase family 15 [Candidatus Woesearchaeota archaeon]|nr:MAG: glycoside hydrolase family 15 [Candidatus Woesearchaeota archaeon]